MSDTYILALDPSCVRVTGCGLFRFADDALILSKPVCVASVQIDPDAMPKGTFPKRLDASIARADKIAYAMHELSRFAGSLPVLPQVFACEIPIGTGDVMVNEAIGAFKTLSVIRSVPHWIGAHSSKVKSVQGASALARLPNRSSAEQRKKKEKLKENAVNWANGAIVWNAPLSVEDDALADTAAVAVVAWQLMQAKRNGAAMDEALKGGRA